ncbi:hypothetical protein HOY82DRAFT_576221 [Tuber indicum]|nr:hypothetical protein HOY82DRAFT_576221 [Tuber indicum]
MRQTEGLLHSTPVQYSSTTLVRKRGSRFNGFTDMINFSYLENLREFDFCNLTSSGLSVYCTIAAYPNLSFLLPSFTRVRSRQRGPPLLD